MASLIDPTVIVDGENVSKAALRAQLGHARDEITDLQAGGGGGNSWVQSINESGASALGLTVEAGTWDSDGSVIRQTNTGSAVVGRALLNDAVAPGLATAWEAEIRIPSAGQAQSNLYAGISIAAPTTYAAGAFAVRMQRVSGTWQFQIEREALSGIGTSAFAFALDTWFRFLVVRLQSTAEIFVGGTMIYSGNPGVTVYGQRMRLNAPLGTVAHFRNIKAWSLPLP